MKMTVTRLDNLTLTSVVFESVVNNVPCPSVPNLTLTSVVFEFAKRITF